MMMMMTCCDDDKSLNRKCYPFLRYSTLKNGVTLKSGLGVVEGHWKWHYSICRVRVPIGVP